MESGCQVITNLVGNVDDEDEENLSKTTNSNLVKVSSKDEVEGRIRRNSQSIEQIISVDVLSEESIEKMSPNTKRKYLLSKRQFAIESKFNESRIVVTDFVVKELNEDEDYEQQPSPAGVAMKRVSSYGIIF